MSQVANTRNFLSMFLGESTTMRRTAIQVARPR
jgi:hypothetical protein